MGTHTDCTSELIALMAAHDLDRRHVAEILGVAIRTVAGWLQPSHPTEIPPAQLGRLREACLTQSPAYLQAKKRQQRLYSFGQPNGREVFVQLIHQHPWLTSKQIAEITGVAPKTAEKWRTKGVPVPMRYVVKIAEALRELGVPGGDAT